MPTLQEQYNSIKRGNGNKEQFLKHARNLFPEYFNQYTDFDTATNVLKSKQIISEAAGGVVSKGFDIFDWKKILENLKPEDLEIGKIYKYSGEITLGPHKGEKITGELEFEEKINDDMFRFIWKKIDNPNAPNARVGRPFQTSKTGLQYLTESVKAEEKETSKEVLDDQKNAYNNSDMKNADNVNFNEIMKGFYAEMRDEKNAGKTGDEIKAMVVKNLAKDPLFYTKDGMFGEKGVGYTNEAPGLGEPKDPKGKHKSSGYGDLKENILPGNEVEEAMDQGPVSIKGKTGPTGGTQKIPRALFLDKEVISTINDAQPGSIKLISKPGDKRVYMYVSSFVKNALDELERGRSSREKLKKQSKLADVLADKLPSAIRGKIKKEINPKMDSGLKMHYVDLNISPKKDKTGYWVLAKGESAPLVAEQKLRSLIQQIIKEELSK